MIGDFSPWSVYYLEITCGENSRAALDYLLHYRNPHMIGIDADYRMSRDYSAQGWPTFLVIDQEGTVRFHGFDADRELAGIRKCLKGLLRTPTNDAGQVTVGGVAYPAAVLRCQQARRDQSPRLAFEPSGAGHLVFQSNRDGANAIYARRLDQKGEGPSETRLSPVGQESYGPDCIVDSGGSLWVTWCGRSNGFYNIFVRSASGREQPVIEQLTASDDDAMGARIAAGPEGKLAVVYYKWAKMQGISRDRNVFARTYNPAERAWEAEQEISPPEPKVEDHTDPDVAIDNQGTPWVVWSYDYHPQLFRKPLQAEQPTIFAAKFSGGKAGEALCVGATGQLQHAIDLFPSMAFDSAGALWCAWDCSEPRRSIQLARMKAGAESFEPVRVFGRQPCSTPELSATASGALLLAWSEKNQGHWDGKVILLRNGIAGQEVNLSESENVLFPQATQAPDGRYWVVYQKAGPRGSEIVCRDISADIR